jgi:hypothetical protein
MRSPEEEEHIRLVRIMVKSAYSLQKIRLQVGLRLVANFSSRVKSVRLEKKDLELYNTMLEGAVSDVIDEEEGSAKKRVDKIIDDIKREFKTITAGIARRRRPLPPETEFKGGAIITNYMEAVLTNHYLDLESQEARQFRDLEYQLGKVPIWNNYLKHQTGIGPAMGGILITFFDPYKAKYVSNFWAHAGLDVVINQDGTGTARSWRREHLIEREYVDRSGKTKTRLSVTYNPWLKPKMVGVLGSKFLQSGSTWASNYYNYKHRLQTDPNRLKVTTPAWKKLYHAGQPVAHLWTPGRIHKAAVRYMVKQFLKDFHREWRLSYGLEVPLPYEQAKLGMQPHTHAAE